MDWARAKSVLIGIFLALNIFLLVYLRIYYFQPDIPKDTISDTMRILHSRGIKVSCEIPSKEYRNNLLDFDSNDYSRVKAAERLLGTKIEKKQVKIDHQLEYKGKIIKFKTNNELIYLDVNPGDNIDINSKAVIKKISIKFLKSLRLPAKGFIADSIIKYDDHVKICFYEKYKGFTIYDNWFEITVSGKGITYMKYKYIKVKALRNDPQKRIIPAYSLLLRNSNYGAQDVTGLELGFRKPGDKREVFIWFSEPYWRVKLKTGENRFFNAFTGNEETSYRSKVTGAENN